MTFVDDVMKRADVYEIWHFSIDYALKYDSGLPIFTQDKAKNKVGGAIRHKCEIIVYGLDTIEV